MLLDLKVFEELNFHGVAILTALTAQNTEKVKKIFCIPPDFLWTQYTTLKEDMSISGIKVGMAGCRDTIEVIKKILAENRNIPIVVDPVFKSSSGTWLIEKNSVNYYIENIRSLASILTPNTDEAEMISGIKITRREKMEDAAAHIFSLAKIPCVIKGGKFKSTIVDTLYDGREFHYYEKEKIEKEVHGTGCFFSSILLCFLAQGKPLKEACLLSSQLTHQAREKSIKIGRGQNIISFPLE